MSWHAVDAVDDAIEATRRFLFPFSLVRWMKLALLVLFMGGGVSANASGPGTLSSGGSVLEEVALATEGPIDGSVPIDSLAPVDGSVPIDGVLPVVMGIGILLTIVVISVISLSLRLVFYDALHTNEVRLWRPFISRLRQAVGLFAVSAVLSVAVAAPIVTAVLITVLSTNPIGWQPIDLLATTLMSLSTGPTVALGVVGALFGLLSVLALRLTYEFVVPTMIVEDSGAIAGWQRLWRSLRGNWIDVAIYFFVHLIIGIGIAIVEGLAVVLAGATVVVVAGIVLLVASVPLGGFGAVLGTTVGIAVLSVVLLVSLLALLVLVLPVRILTRSYMISYEVSTLGGIDRSLALLHPETGLETETSELQ